MNVKTLIAWIIVSCALVTYGCTELIANDEVAELVENEEFANMKAPKAFNKCMACHGFEKNKLGPHLRGLIGRPIAGVEGYRYSKALKEYGVDKTWDITNLQIWLLSPRKMVPKTKMIFAGIKKEQEMNELVEYLKTK
jgi:cytochrome c